MPASDDIQFRPLFEQYIEAFNRRDLDATMSFLSFPLRLRHESNDMVLTYDHLKMEYQSHWDVENFKSVEIKEIEELTAPEKGVKATLHDHGQSKIVTISYHYEQGADGEWKHSFHDITSVETVNSDPQTTVA